LPFFFFPFSETDFLILSKITNQKGMDKTVFILGAGFSKNENAPLQAEIIREIFQINTKELSPNYRKIYTRYRNDFKNFLSETMFIDEKKFESLSLEDIYTPIDRCILDNLAFRNIAPKDLIELRQKINGLIIIMLDYKLHLTRPKGSHVEKFTDYLIALRKKHLKDDPFAIISTNWDILVDASFRGKIPPEEGVVDYCCNPTAYDANEPIIPGLSALEMNLYNIKLLKLHGSMNWLQCKRCQRLFVTFFEKIAIDEYVTKPICRECDHNFRNELTSDRGGYLSSLLIMPTLLKDLNNFQLKLVWQNAGIELSEASKIVFMGYSFPMADFELRQLLARNVRHNSSIEVILSSEDKPAHSNYVSSAENRYRTFFGKRDVQIHYEGVKKYIDELV